MRLIQQAKQKLNIWVLLSSVFILIILLPTMLVAKHFFAEPNENWLHIKEYLLLDILSNTLVLIILTGVLTTIIGVSLAWVVTAYQFPLRNFLKWALILPLAIPPFIGAYTYQGILDYTGIIQSTLRNAFDIHVDQKYFDIMNIGGAVFIFTMFLFPYMYVITRSFLANQSASIIENARILGGGSVGTFFRIVLPISRTAIIGGVSIIALEVINDYGVVKYFGIQTFITAIFQTWSGMSDLESAFKLAGTLMVVVILLLLFEKFARGRKRYSYSSTKIKPITPKRLTGYKATMATTYCLAVFSFAFMIPFIQLVLWTFMTYEKIVTVEFFALIKNSFFVAAISSILIVIVAVIISNYTRIYQGIYTKVIAKITVLGYSIPGAVIAISVITIFVGLDKYLMSIFSYFQMDPIIVFRTSIVMLITAYVIRFLTVGYNSIEAGFEKIGNSFTEASRSLGVSTVKTFFKVDIPMLKGAIFGGFILVFIDILKELPLTMLLQPFNFFTLATKAFRYANDEMVNEAASASLIIILISGICIFFFHKISEKGSGQ
ncbi:iron(III) transport system permease protein [Salirhabdus euzebyi]|uniref:Iron(III) transport system permease protein n=1 Tax=Salirhabdus euzebyi TaxID=394506 RepID=A0A841PUB2_9BACI|nr:iron ABC transporter permease [Salirhabdus euzebyi]MBB6452587.1 iron(III) transport system permease protein [Salirhabdus euzebyi]